MLVSGAEKAEAVAAAVAGADPVAVPAAGAVGREKTLWLLDSAAAANSPASGGWLKPGGEDAAPEVRPAQSRGPARHARRHIRWCTHRAAA